VYPEDIDLLHNPEDQHYRRLRGRLRGLAHELNKRLKQRKTPVRVEQRHRCNEHDGWSELRLKVLPQFKSREEETPLSPEQLEMLMELLRTNTSDLNPGDKKDLRKLEVQHCKQRICFLLEQQNEMETTELWKKLRADTFSDQSIRIAIRELRLKRRLQGFGPAGKWHVRLP
jgi:hypothetical protein